jgi:hypothetical protein
LRLQYHSSTEKKILNQCLYAKRLGEKILGDKIETIATPYEYGINLSPYIEGTDVLGSEEDFRAIIGGLMYLATSTRPDICFGSDVLVKAS